MLDIPQDVGQSNVSVRTGDEPTLPEDDHEEHEGHESVDDEHGEVEPLSAAIELIRQTLSHVLARLQLQGLVDGYHLSNVHTIYTTRASPK